MPWRGSNEENLQTATNATTANMSPIRQRMNKTAEGGHRPRPNQNNQLQANVKPPLARILTAGAAN